MADIRFLAEIALLVGGGLSAIGGGAAILVGGATWAISILEKFLDRYREQGRERAEAHMRHVMLDNSWWFSHDQPTMFLIQDLARGVSIAAARENYEAHRKTEKNVTDDVLAV